MLIGLDSGSANHRATDLTSCPAPPAKRQMLA